MSFNMAEASARITAQTEGQDKITALSGAVKDLSAQVKLFAAQAGVGGSEASKMAAQAQVAARGMNELSKGTGNARIAQMELMHVVRGSVDQFAAGAPLTQIFAMHIAMLGQAASMAGESMGAVGAFLAGPWGIAVTAAVAIGSTLVQKLWDTSDALDKVKISTSTLHDEQGILGGVFDTTTGKMKDQTGAAMALAKAQIILAQATARKNLSEANAQIAGSAANQLRFGVNVEETNPTIRANRQRAGLATKTWQPFSYGVDPAAAEVQRQFASGAIDANKAIDSLKRMRDAGRLTDDTFTQLSAAYANNAVETKNLKDLTDGYTSLLTGHLAEGLRTAEKGHKKHKEAMTEAEKEARRWAKSQQEMNDLILRGNGLMDERIAKLSQMGSLATAIIGAPKQEPQTLWEQLSADNAAAMNDFSKAQSPMQKGIESYKASIADTGKTVADSWAKSLKATEDALTNFVVTGKLSFKDLANSIVADLARIAIQKAIMGPIMAALGFSNGGAFSGGSVVAHANGGVFGGVQAFAGGGVVGRPTLFPMSGGRTGLMGEAGPEAIMPLRRLSNGRLGVETAGGGGNTTVAVSVDASGSKVQGDSGNGAELGRAIGQAVQAELIRQRRPGGLLAA